ncbi:unnamed protein product, partial [Choristocarpus tenellus]
MSTALYRGGTSPSGGNTWVARQRLVRVTQPSHAWTIRGVLVYHTCVVEAGVMEVVFAFVKIDSQYQAIMDLVPRGGCPGGFDSCPLGNSHGVVDTIVGSGKRQRLTPVAPLAPQASFITYTHVTKHFSLPLVQPN